MHLTAGALEALGRIVAEIGRWAPTRRREPYAHDGAFADEPAAAIDALGRHAPRPLALAGRP